MTRLNFSNRAALACALALRVAQALSGAISRQGHATLAVSGGTTPTLFFEHLSKADITWQKVTITLVDERKVPDTHPRSNARLVKAKLLQNHAAAAKFVPLFENFRAEKIADFDACILGMGLDGHTASFFPDGDRVAEGLKPSSKIIILEINAAGAGETRLTFTLAKLLRSRHLFLHIEGEDKEAVLMKQTGLPIHTVIEHAPNIAVYFCP